MKVIVCQHCGQIAATLPLGRSATRISVIELCDALAKHGSIREAANALGCSRGLVYKILKANGIKKDCTKIYDFGALGGKNYE